MNVLLTGASSGVGLAILRLLLDNGDSVFAHYRTSSPGLEKLAEKYAPGGRLRVHRSDFEYPEQVKSLMDAYDAEWGRLDALVNNAGEVIEEARLEEIDLRLWRRVFAVNVEAPFLLSQWAFRKMAEEGGKILNIGSISAKYVGGETTFHYGVSKATVDALTLGFARRGAEKGICVNAVRPGVTDTDAHQKYTPGKDMKKRIAMVPMKRMARPDEIASLAVYFLSKSADYITGQIVSVAGGD